MQRFLFQHQPHLPKKLSKPGLGARTNLRSGRRREGHCKLTGVQKSMGFCCDGNRIVDCGSTEG